MMLKFCYIILSMIYIILVSMVSFVLLVNPMILDIFEVVIFLTLKNYNYEKKKKIQKTPYVTAQTFSNCISWRYLAALMRCLAPLTIKNRRFGAANQQLSDKRYIDVPCGDCFACRQTLRSQWNFRLSQQLLVSDIAYFITITYSDDNLPYFDGMPFPDKRDLQLFFKRLRKNYPHSSFKYYAISEYGEHTNRPHFHVILFVNNPDSFDFLNLWKLGHIKVGTVNAASINYVTKQHLIPKDVQKSYVVPTFRLVSKGLGLDYINDDNIHFYARRTDKPYILSEGGLKISMPRYYRDKFPFDFKTDYDIIDAWNTYLENHPDVPVKKLCIDFNRSIEILNDRRNKLLKHSKF